MCKRRCPVCHATSHYHQYGIPGYYITCECGVVLACRRDSQAAPLDLTEVEAAQWITDGTFVLPGAEAEDVEDDRTFHAYASMERGL